MGKEHSKGVFPLIGGPPIEVTDSYVLTPAQLNDNACSVFSGTSSPNLLSLANNLKIYRHPNIVKYISSGTHDGRFYIVTEPVRPLFQVIADQSSLEICIGLHSIITALSFLHNQAGTSHNNVCRASIFSTPSGSWKLGGVEFMDKFANVTVSRLQEMRPRRYEPATAPEERAGRITIPSAIDVYAVGVLLNELLDPLSSSGEDCLPGLNDLLLFCKSKILQADPQLRCLLADVARHEFFSHDFIKIFQFLSEVPLKCVEDKVVFFRELENQLKSLPEKIVASQLLHFLLARVVVMDPSAQNILPMLLRPRTDGITDGSLFSDAIFRQFVVPKILQMFCVRDTSVRLLLLTHLQSYLNCFTKEQLQLQLLPELLVGIKDESDELVAATLHALAFLVGALGGSAVVGPRRARLFSDGRPITRTPRAEIALPERPSPDGGEDSVIEDNDIWSDWDQPINRSATSDTGASSKTDSPEVTEMKLKESLKDRAVTITAKTMADIESLDIKNGGGWRTEKGPDFFSDMEPVISRTCVAVVNETNKFDVSEAGAAGDAWEGFEDWSETTQQ